MTTESTTATSGKQRMPGFQIGYTKKILSIQPSLRTDHQGFRSGIGRIPDPTQFLTVKKRVLKGNCASFYGRLMIKKLNISFVCLS